MQKRKILIIGSFIAVTLNLALTGIAMGQSNTSTVSVNRSGSLSFIALPSSFDFGSMGIPTGRTATFSDATATAGNLPQAKRLAVQDTRGQGGFTLTLSANGDFSDGGSNSILVSNASPDDNLRIVTSPLFNGASGTTTNGVVYESGFSGPEDVTALVNTAATDFSDEATFTSVSNNILDTATPVDVLNGTLSSSTGRIGIMDVGSSAMLYIPAYQAAGSYTTTLTWTLADSTT